jgi:hypothetical protein
MLEVIETGGRAEGWLLRTRQDIEPAGGSRQALQGEGDSIKEKEPEKESVLRVWEGPE